MSNPQPDERTSLSVGEGRYHATEPAPPAADRPAGFRGAALPRLAIACVAIFSLVFLASMLLSKPAGGAPNAQHGGAPGGSSGEENLQDTSPIFPGVEDGVIPSMQPFSTMDPADVHCPHMDRPSDTWPTAAWGALTNASVDLHTSLPTNAWWENIALGSPTQETRANNIVVLPYTFDVAGDTAGLRIHFPQVLATDLIVRTAFDWRHALQLGCVETVSPHYITQPGPLSVTLNWRLNEAANSSSSSFSSKEALLPGDGSAPAMSVPAVRGSPYATMEYRGVRPVVSARQEVTQLIVDGGSVSLSSSSGGDGGCGANGTLVRVEREAEIVFSGGAVSSDDTWLVFTSSPTDFLCSSWFAMERGDPPTPGAVGAWESMPRFRLEAVEPVAFGVVRAALVNGCSSGRGGSRCERRGVADDRSRYAELLRAHAEVYPTGEARVAYSSSTLDWIQDALQGDNLHTAGGAGADKDRADAATTTAAMDAAAAAAADSADPTRTGVSSSSGSGSGKASSPPSSSSSSSSDSSDSGSSSSSSSSDSNDSGSSSSSSNGSSSSSNSSSDSSDSGSSSSSSSSDGSGSSSGGSNEEGTLRFLWAPRRMDGEPIIASEILSGSGSGSGAESGNGSRSESGSERGGGSMPLIMFALLHHTQTFSSADRLTGVGTPTLHGQAVVVIGDEWSLKVDLPPVSFGVGRPVREEMVDDINEALDTDVGYEIPANYLRGEGDTYFSGKMLAKMGRIALIAEEMGRHHDAKMVAARLAEASQVWLNGTAASPFLYDFRWGGVVSCGCAYSKGHGCTNGIGPHECPALSDPGMNFGQGFYNDHHFHYGYHIFAAAIAARFFPEWGVKHHEAVTLLIRDIANPSSSDPFFPVFRHKDWYLGSSWALGIPTLGGVPYMNGRNQESSSEAVNAYYAVALYGHVMAQVFTTAGDPAKAQTASLVRDTGRQLLATEVHSAQIYWQVANMDTPGMPRVYPEAYKPHVVGMLWSTLAQMQTWFGAEAWKVYGIQMLPITAVSEQLLAPRWVQQMLPSFEDSCLYDSNPVKACVVEGWSMLVHAGQAITGRWEDGRDGILALPDDAFETAGGNGHSRTSMLWFVANRPPAPPTTDDDDTSSASSTLSPPTP